MAEQTMVTIWLRIIASWALFGAIVIVCFHIFVYLGVIDEPFSAFDFFESSWDTLSGTIIFTGLWRPKPWGWKAAVLIIPLGWLIGSYNLISDNYRGLGAFSALFVMIDGAIIRYLFKENVMRHCNVFSTWFTKLKWTANALFLFASYLILNDIVGAPVAFCGVLGVAMGMAVAKRQKDRLKHVKT